MVVMMMVMMVVVVMMVVMMAMMILFNFFFFSPDTLATTKNKVSIDSKTQWGALRGKYNNTAKYADCMHSTQVSLTLPS